MHHGCMNTKTPPRIEIFRAGDQVSTDGRAMSFSVADLHAIAANYDPALAKAPLVVGHPKVEDPAYGWASGLSVEGDTLFAETDQVEAQFAGMVHAGRFPNRSAAIFLPSTPGNPKPGQLYLKHIGFLGAAAPAVPGLAPVPASFAATDDAITFSFPLVQQEPSMDPKKPAGQPDPADAATFAAQNAARSAELDQREAALAARENAVNAAAEAAEAATKAADRAAAVTFAAGLVKAGKVLPAQQDAVVELMVLLPAADQPVTFAAGASTVSRPARDLLRELLEGATPQIDYSEKSRGSHAPAAVEFAAPQGTHVSEARVDQYARVKSLQAQNPNLSVVEAARLAGA